MLPDDSEEDDLFREESMLRKIIEIDETACNGCGLCVAACHEGAIGLVEGKARLLRDDYCDGLGDCLPACPTGAITFVEREAEAYDEQAVLAAKAAAGSPADGSSGHAGAAPEPVAAARHAAGCPGSLSRFFAAEDSPAASARAGCAAGVADASAAAAAPDAPPRSRLAQWPVEIKLAPVQAPYFAGAHVLIAADCTAFAYADFHRGFMRGRITLIGCPKLDGVDYSQKLEALFASNDIASVTVARMEVPCCGGLEHAARAALERSGKNVPFEVAVISTKGALLERR